MRCVIAKRSIIDESGLSDFQLKGNELVSQFSLTNVEFQSHTFETTKWVALYFLLC